MKKTAVVLKLCIILFSLVLHNSCQTKIISGIDRPINRPGASWEAIGSVRYEYMAPFGESSAAIPYDELLQIAHEKYGDKGIDIIEIKVEKKALSTIEKAQLYKEKKKSYSFRYIYNAIVIKYGSNTP